jgi:hypothetical protein
MLRGPTSSVVRLTQLFLGLFKILEKPRQGLPELTFCIVFIPEDPSPDVLKLPPASRLRPLEQTVAVFELGHDTSVTL